MYDIFSYGRGKILLEDSDFYEKIFSEARSKTAEHNIYERAGKGLAEGNEKTQKQAKMKDN